MSENTKIAMIFGAVAVVAGGGLFYYFKIHAPKQQRSAAQTEILAWEERFLKARHCLFGLDPVSGDSAEALAVREMAPDPWDRTTCTSLISKLSRGVAEDTGMMPVEHAWMSIDRAASRVANAFATHVDPFGEAPENRDKRSPLPDALAALDEAQADLRKAAGMDPPPASTRPKLAAAEIIPITVGKDPVTRISHWFKPSAGGAIAFGATANGETQIQLVPGSKTVKAVPIGHGALRAVPDLSWAAGGITGEAILATVDEATGSFTNAGTVSAKVPGSPRAIAAVGRTNRLGIYLDEGVGITLLHRTSAAMTGDKPIPTLMANVGLDPSGRVFAAWTFDPPEPAAKKDEEDYIGRRPSGRLQGALTDGEEAVKVIELGTGSPGALCLTTKTGWVLDNDQAIELSSDGKPRPHVLPRHELAGCSTDSVLLVDHSTNGYTVCNETCRKVTITAHKATTTATLVNNKVHAIRARDRVLGVWRENLPPRFFALPAQAQPLLAYSDGKVIDILAVEYGEDAKSGTKAMLVRVPAT